jgi:hypothetical protein
MPCLCPQCTPTPAPTWCPAHQYACLARSVAQMRAPARIEFISKQRVETLRALYLHPPMFPYRSELERAAKERGARDLARLPAKCSARRKP